MSEMSTYSIELMERLKNLLTATEYAIVEYLVQTPGTIRSPREISNEIWHDDGYTRSFDKSLHVHVHNMRLKMDASDTVIVIHNVRGKGYYVD